MYYLQSRYYNPEIGRILNTDDPECVAIGTNALACNLYTYCYNDSVNGTDHGGQLVAKIIEKIFVGILVGFLKQAAIDIIEWVFKKYVLKRTVSFSTSPAEDYVSTILSSVVDQFKPSCRAFVAVGVINILVKYLPKMIRGDMKQKDWLILLVDIVTVYLLSLLSDVLRKLDGKIKQIRRLRWGISNSASFRIPLKNVKNKIRYWGVTVNFAIPISQQLISSFINALCK